MRACDERLGAVCSVSIYDHLERGSEHLAALLKAPRSKSYDLRFVALVVRNQGSFSLFCILLDLGVEVMMAADAILSYSWLAVYVKGSPNAILPLLSLPDWVLLALFFKPVSRTSLTPSMQRSLVANSPLPTTEPNAN
jgi:hypothetical protein